MEPNTQNIENLNETLKTLEPKMVKKGSLLRKVKWLFILASVLAVVIFFASTIGVNKLRSLRAGSEAKTYVSKLYPGYTIGGIVCQGEDTDGDSYVSCDLNIGNLTDNRVINIQCPTIIKSFLGTSCKQARPAYIAQ